MNNSALCFVFSIK